jgi:hypothetical protein
MNGLPGSFEWNLPVQSFGHCLGVGNGRQKARTVAQEGIRYAIRSGLVE